MAFATTTLMELKIGKPLRLFVYCLSLFFIFSVNKIRSEEIDSPPHNGIKFAQSGHIVSVTTPPHREDGNELTVEASFYVPGENGFDAEASKSWAANELKDIREEFPSSTIEVSVLENEKFEYQSIDPADPFKEIDEAYHIALDRLEQKDQKKNNLKLTLVRGIINGAVATTSLIYMSSIPFEQAIPLALLGGLITGSMSAGFQYTNLFWLRFIGGKGWLNPSTTERAGAFESILKQLTIGAVCLAIFRGVMIHVGMIDEPFTFATVGVSAFMTALRGIYPRGFLKLLQAELTLEAMKNSPNRKASIQKLSDAISVLISVTFTALETLDTLGLEIAKMSLLGLGTAGALTYAFHRSTRVKEAIKPFFSNLKTKTKSVCSRFLSRSPQESI